MSMCATGVVSVSCYLLLDFEMLPKCSILVDIVNHYQGRSYKDATTHVGAHYLKKHISTFYFKILP
jgi:hypothetical protein